MPVSDETPLHRLAASDRQLRDLETKLAATRQAIDSFCDVGLEPPQSLVDSSLSRELVDARCISSNLQGANRPPSQQPGVSSHRQRFAAAAAAAGPSVSWRQPYAFAPGQPTSDSSGHSFRPGGDSSPHKRRRLPVENSSDDEHNPLQASCYRNEHNPLQVSCYRTKERATRRIVALPPWRCYLTTL